MVEMESDGNLSRMIVALIGIRHLKCRSGWGTGDKYAKKKKKNKDTALKEMFKCKKIL